MKNILRHLSPLVLRLYSACGLVLFLTSFALAAGSPGVQVGQSVNGDMQQVGSAGRQVDQVQGYIQVVWSNGDQFSINMTVDVTDLQVTGGPSPLTLDNGESISVLALGNSFMSASLSGPSVRSRIANIRILPDRRGIVVFHEVASAFIAPDFSQGSGFFMQQLMPNPVGSDTSRFIKHALDFTGSDTIVHATGSCRTFFTSTLPQDMIRQNEYYWRGRITGPAASVVWSPPVLVDSLFPLTAIVEASPVSNEVAIVYVNSRPGALGTYDNDLYYRRSTDAGLSWGSATNITSYGEADHPRAYTDVTAVYDNDNTLHIAYNTIDVDTLFGLSYIPCKLWHWNSQRGTSRLVAVADWWNTCSDLSYDRAGQFNLQITKPTLSIKPAGAGPGAGIPGEVVYLHWVQFGPTATDCATRNQFDSTGGYVNGEIYGASSSDDGLTWDRPRNMTGTVTPDCLPGDCRSEHWVTAAARADSGIFLTYVEDKHAGATTYAEGYPTTSPVRVLAVATRPATADPRIVLDPDIRPYHSVAGDHYDVDVVAFTDRTSSFALGVINPGTATLNFTATVLPDNGGSAHVRINGGSSYSSSISAAGAENVTTLDVDGIGLPPGQTDRLWTLRIVSNDADHDTLWFHLSVTVEEVACPIVMTGDVNVNGSVTSADIIALVNYVFKSGAPPLPCVASGDVNCNGTVTSADVIALVNFVFKSGAPPCDGCTSSLATGC